MKRIDGIALWADTACIAFAIDTRTAKVLRAGLSRGESLEKIQGENHQTRDIREQAVRL